MLLGVHSLLHTGDAPASANTADRIVLVHQASYLSLVNAIDNRSPRPFLDRGLFYFRPFSLRQRLQTTEDATALHDLIWNRDTKYGSASSQVAQSNQIEELATPVQAAKANAICERTIGSLKWERLGHVLITDQRQLNRVVRECTDYYDDARTQQGKCQ